MHLRSLDRIEPAIDRSSISWHDSLYRKVVPTMTAPMLGRKNTRQLRELRDRLVKSLHPQTIDDLKRLRAVNDLTYDEARTLSEYEALEFLIGE